MGGDMMFLLEQYTCQNIGS